MKTVLRFSSLVLGLLSQQAQAQSWYFLRYWSPSDAVSFTSFSGDMLVPATPNPNLGTPYTWPGLQDIGTTGVFQSVLDGRNTNPNYSVGEWVMADGWCCGNPDLAWGPGLLKVVKGDSIHFTYNRDVGGVYWNTTLTLNNDPSTTVIDSYPLAYKSFDQVLFAIELYDQAWNFGSVIFENVVITTNSTDTAWCTNPPENYASSTNYSLGAVTATVKDASNTMTCEIASVNLWAPA